MRENPKQYFINHEVLSLIWITLFESGNEELATTLSDSMIAQGCQELSGTEDKLLMLMFWKNYMEDNNIAKFSNNNKEEMH